MRPLAVGDGHPPPVGRRPLRPVPGRDHEVLLEDGLPSEHLPPGYEHMDGDGHHAFEEDVAESPEVRPDAKFLGMMWASRPGSERSAAETAMKSA